MYNQDYFRGQFQNISSGLVLINQLPLRDYYWHCNYTRNEAKLVHSTYSKNSLENIVIQISLETKCTKYPSGHCKYFLSLICSNVETEKEQSILWTNIANTGLQFTFHYQLMHLLIKTLSQFTFKTTHVKMSVMCT